MKFEHNMLHHCLSGLPFPASTKDIIEYARNKGADGGIIDLLQSLPRKIYKYERQVFEDITRHFGIVIT